MIKYRINSSFKVETGFTLTTKEISGAVNDVNTFLTTLPFNLYRSIDFKTTGAMIGALLCTKIAEHVPECVVNPIEKGHPDIIPRFGLHSSEEVLRNYPRGIEVKCTIGNLKKGINLKAGERRIDNLSAITWQAHHCEVNHLLGVVWDFAAEQDGLLFPAITALFFSDELSEKDWGRISGTTGRNTKVTGLRQSGKQKMGKEPVMLHDNDLYVEKYASLMGFSQLEK